MTDGLCDCLPTSTTLAPAHPPTTFAGGNSKTCIIACVSPAPDCAQETCGTLAFAAGAKRIRNRVGAGGRASGWRHA